MCSPRWLLHAPLDNVFWHALTGSQATFASGQGGARRYAAGLSPIVGFADVARPDFDALRVVCVAGERFYSDGWSGAVPAGWQLELESTMFKMVWHGEPPGAGVADAVPLGPEHAVQAVALASLTRPGPFGPRTLELGDYLGVFDGDHLIAMAGERAFARPLREVSGICTHPDFQGQGLAQRLTAVLIRRQLARGETPFLHVMRDNLGARSMYRRMGFRDAGESVVRVICLE